MATPAAEYTLADTSTCSGALSFDDRDLGINNQLQSLSFMVCMANLTRACSLYAPPLGYIPCGLHMPGDRKRRACTVKHEHAAVDVRRLLRFPPDLKGLLDRGAELGERIQETSYGIARPVGRCRRDESNESCAMCSPYGQNPWGCGMDKVPRAGRTHIIYAYGLRYHLRSSRDRTWKKPVCPLLQLQLMPEVERYSRDLMARLKLVPGEFVAAQYRTGWAWRVHTRKLNQPWACYGMRTINTSLLKLSQAARGSGTRASGYVGGADGVPLTKRPMFLLTNAHGLHEASVPVPLQVLSEIRITSLAHTVLLNPMSSFQDAIVGMRGGRHRLHFVKRVDAVDTCGCIAADERELDKLGSVGEFRGNLCSNATAFEEWIRAVRQREHDVIERRRAAITKGSLNRSSAPIVK